MSQTKYRMPPDVRESCISVVRGYRRRVRAYHQKRSDIIHSSPELYDTYIVKNGAQTEERRAYKPQGSGQVSRPTEGKQARLEAVEGHPDTIRMRAVEQALLSVGDDLANEVDRQLLREAIMSSCIKGRYFTFDYWPLPMEKTSFYERRRAFLHMIASLLGYL